MSNLLSLVQAGEDLRSNVDRMELYPRHSVDEGGHLTVVHHVGLIIGEHALPPLRLYLSPCSTPISFTHSAQESNLKRDGKRQRLKGTSRDYREYQF